MRIGYAGEGGSSPALLLGSAVGALGLGACIAVLFFSMAAIMSTGTGFVAVGGPYEIASPAPGWIWVVPTSIVVGWVFGGLLAVSSWRLDRINVAGLIWSAVFLLLGFDFLLFGLRPAVEEGIVWGWLICGVVFVAMGLAPALAPVRRTIAERRFGSTAFGGDTSHRMQQSTRRLVVTGIVVAIVLGFVLGGWFFASLAA